MFTLVIPSVPTMHQAAPLVATHEVTKPYHVVADTWGLGATPS